ncbi:MAG: putative transcriptional regulator [Candidatus Tokpelaia sp. JSC189]|nr:MAG: putative transcriptional regulator [Candidatus Tokpelaia sp. JSC189]
MIFREKFKQDMVITRNMKLSERIKQARKDARLTQDQMAEQLGITKGAVSQWEAGKTKPRNGTLKKIAKITGKPVVWLMDLNDVISFDEIGRSSLEKSSIPVYGQSATGSNDEIDLHQQLFSIACPPQLYGVKNVYALLIPDNMMSPRYELGEIIFIDPTRHARTDDYVVIQIRNDKTSRLQAFIGKLVRHNSEELVIRHLNPGLALYFSHEQILSIGLIVISSTIR